VDELLVETVPEESDFGIPFKGQWATGILNHTSFGVPPAVTPSKAPAGLKKAPVCKTWTSTSPQKHHQNDKATGASSDGITGTPGVYTKAGDSLMTEAGDVMKANDIMKEDGAALAANDKPADCATY
jgi:hypothetical protein